MDLHRAGKRSQWHDVPPRQRNAWQQLARRTNGVLTPGNGVSLVGAVVVAVGLINIYRGAFALGLALLAVGRTADVADGLIASRTGTKSPLGEAVDASIDKLSMLAALITFVLAGVVPIFAILLVAVLNAAIAALGVIAKIRGRTVHPSLPGKLATAFQWMAFLLYIAAELLRTHTNTLAGDMAALLGTLAIAASFIFGMTAIRGYSSAAFHASQGHAK
jgi:cardiolipin synthase